ncbi:sce7726 family protein [Aliivibrio fischeri]|uniref:sce7726 family protein n=1 Tax=Aliivibrio fischeri TaxID=668 RepID=UPI0012D9D647|nr:sce7726 family protein [Aliivibrio fischeri]MUK78984.1 sce7726 family protein [Aliivibrio fischeri]
MILNDKNIRKAFILKLNRMNPKPKKIIEELSVANGCAIADIVSVNKIIHCYEIKGESDKIERALKQAKYYDQAFNKITLITTSNHLKKAVSLIPNHWGIIESIYTEKDGRIKFKYHRKATSNSSMDKFVAMQTLWKSEMLKVSELLGVSFLTKEKNRDFIANKISNENNKNIISEMISDQLKLR